MADGRSSPHDRFKRRRKREAQRLQPDGDQVWRLLRNKKRDARDLLGIRLGFDRKSERPDAASVQRVVVEIVMIAIVVVEVVTSRVRMQPACAVMSFVVVIRVRMHQRCAQRANWHGYRERDGEEPATHCLHSNGIRGLGARDSGLGGFGRWALATSR